VDTATAVFELRGTVEGCVDTPDLAVRGCSTKALAWMEEEETEEEGLPSLVLDDPSTAAAADFWLHPCDCAPPAWGTGLPVNPDSFEHVPVDSNNNFIPAPFTIVTGQLVCPSRQLLPGGVGVHFQSEEEMLEPADCEARCRNQDDCAWVGSIFFWMTGDAADFRMCFGHVPVACEELEVFSRYGQILIVTDCNQI